MKQQLQQIYQDLAAGRLSKAQALEGIRTLKLRQQDLQERDNALVLASPVWRESSGASTATQYTEQHILLCELPEIDAVQVGKLVANGRCQSLRAEGNEDIADRYSDYAVTCFETLQAILRSKPRGPVLIRVVMADQSEQRVFAGLSGLLRTAAQENPQIRGQCVRVSSRTTTDELARWLNADPGSDADVLVEYERGTRKVLRWEAMPASEHDANIVFKDSGSYLITGGLGGLGTLFAQEILRQTRQARVILTGRSSLDAARQAILARLSAHADRVDYRTLDVCDSSQVEQLLAAIRLERGQLNGILHAAGTLTDNFILKKTTAAFRRALAPKVSGVCNLDRASRDLDLDFLVLFSSIASVMGNAGQADYAAANGFMDQFAAYRNRLVADGQRRGRTLSINWSFWRDGGMSLDAASLESLHRSSGIEPLQTENGMRAFYRGLQSQHDQVLVMEGDVTQLHSALAQQTIHATAAIQASTVKSPAAAVTGSMLLERTEDYLRKQFSTLLKLPSHRIDPQAGLDKYGIDSILAVNLINGLEKAFGPLSKTLLFEYQTLHGLAEYFVNTHASMLATMFSATDSAGVHSVASEQVETSAPSRAGFPARTRFKPHRADTGSIAAAEPIAIVGLSGRYPESVDIDAYWRNLRDGRDCIVEVPQDRWDWRRYFSADRTQAGHHYSKWGGFIAGVDEFDPLFFNISPKEAKGMDPQERLFLQHAWMAVEDAGYTRASLQASHGQSLAGQVGVYVGAMHSEYQLFGAEASLQGHRMAVSSSFASIANRVSYALNLHGPSLTLDTMCSSSLTAIHLACQDLQQGRTRLAIAGGVNVSIHPNKYLLLSAGQFISSDGHCQSFGEGGDGYIPGEGVGVVILKRLSEAQADGNIIYGFIRGTALNHGGKTNGYTVPNPQAQADVIRQALANAGINPRHVSYIEAHGTGTKLGDPIEITALSQAFRSGSPVTAAEVGFCSIGSAKSNIGHCESAAGIAGLTKVLLQMKHRLIAPSLHSRTLNPHIDFASTPFVVNQTLQEWRRPEVDGALAARIAGISSFGAGGSNAHVLVEEYEAPVVAFMRETIHDALFIVPLSARTAGQLQQKARDLLGLIKEPRQVVDLASLAYTLQVGREAMDERLGFLVNSLAQLTEKLERFIAGDTSVDAMYQGQVGRQKGALSLFGADADFQKTVDQWIAASKLPKLLELWVNGLELDWQRLTAGNVRPRLMSLPTYPFAKERYWIERPAARAVPAEQIAAVLHPLIHTNTSTLTQQSYASTFMGTEPFLEQDAGTNRKVLPEPACLDMIRAALELASPGRSAAGYWNVADTVWGEPIVVSGDTTVNVALLARQNDGVDVEVCSGLDARQIVHCQCRATFGRGQASASAAAPVVVPVVALRPKIALTATDELKVVAPAPKATVSLRNLASPESAPVESSLSAQLASIAASVVRLRDLGEGVFSIAIDAAAAAAEPSTSVIDSLLIALDHVRQETSSKVLLLEVDGSVWQGSRSECNQAIERRLLSAIAAFPSPVIASLPGDASGAGFLLSCICDLMVCSREGHYGYTNDRQGLFPSAAEDRFFRERLGDALADDLLYQTLHQTGEQLQKKGLACTVVSTSLVAAKAQELTVDLAQKSRVALRLLKAHLSRGLRPLIDALSVADSVEAQQQVENTNLLPKLAGAAKYLRIEAHPGGAIVVRLVASRKSYSFKELVANLGNVFEQIERAGCRSIVLASDHDSFLPQTAAIGDPEEALDLRQLLQGCKLPIVTAFTSNAEGIAWLTGLWSDACIYQMQGHYSAAGCLTTPWLAQQLASLLVRRLGSSLSQQVCLTADRYSGLDLKARVAALSVVEAGEVMSQALSLAACWAQWPQASVAAWKQARVADCSNAFNGLPTWQISSDLVAPAPSVEVADTPTSIALQSSAVTVTAHPDGVVVIGMQDRESKNLFSTALLNGLKEAFAHVERTPVYKAVVLTGYENYFSSGGTKETLLAIQEGRIKFTDEPAFQLPMDCSLPVIAALQGHGIGAGWSLGMFADVILLSEESRYLSPYMGYGFTPGAGSTLVFPAKIGHDLARETLLTGREVSGHELQERGVQLSVLPRRHVVATAIDLARRIARQPRGQLENLKRLWTHALVQAREDIYRREVEMHEHTFVGKADTLQQIHARFSEGESVAAVQMASGNAESVRTSGGVELLSVSEVIGGLLAQELHLQPVDIDAGMQFTDLGLDSITGVTWMRRINEHYGTHIEATRIYANPTLAELARFVKLEVEKKLPASAAVAEVTLRQASTVSRVARRELVSWRRTDQPRLAATAATKQQPLSQAIAVIGMAGQFPKATDLEQFWDNIAAGRDCIDEVPGDRWPLDAYYQEGMAAPGKTNSKWLGALAEYDSFDPLFFNISPTEAECMDPQQRVFLQACWRSIENAGYDSQSLSGSRCGVFVGCAAGDYHQLPRKHALTAQDFTGAATSILAARIAYFLNLRGPCISIDTACSSSLVAIADACDSLNCGGSDLALAGGVYVMSGPSMHVMTSQAGMLSTDGRCFTFDQRANGFVIGEGVGVVVLKRLADAERDGDRILGVIQGWGVNQDGKTNGITAPNEESQTRLLQSVYETFAIDPAGIQLIEAHGTGTKLGDPIEIAGLKAAFKDVSDREDACALGSVKSNIGHCLTAAGVAGVIKLILALQHRQLPPAANFVRRNEHIELADSPFYVNDRLRDWNVAAGETRRAAVSSFGFSGTNAHIVIAEHLPAARVGPDVSVLQQDGKFMVPLSARTEAQLRQKVSDLLQLVRKRASSVDLVDLAYTLQVGRDPMGERIAFLVATVPALIAGLESHLAGEQGIPGAYRGQVKHSREEMKLFNQDDEIRETMIKKWLEQRQLSKLLDLWVKGLAFDWNLLYGAAKPRRIELPEYPFAKQRFWFAPALRTGEKGAVEFIHPLLHENVSLLSQQRYRSTFSGSEFFLEQHIEGVRTLSALSLLEMVRAAVTHATSDSGLSWTVELSQVMWDRPLPASDSMQVLVTLMANEDETIGFEVRTAAADGDETLHVHGVARTSVDSPVIQLDLAAEKSHLLQQHFDPAEFYATSSDAGLQYGRRLQSLTAIYRGSDRVLARLSAPSASNAAPGEYILHPSLLEGALHACRLFAGDSASSALPAAMGSLTVVASCVAEMFASVRYSRDEPRTLDVDLYDGAGNACVVIKGLKLSAPLADTGSQAAESSWDGLSYLYRWEERVDSVRNLPVAHKRILVVCSGVSSPFADKFADTLREHYRHDESAAVTLVQASDATTQVSGFETALRSIDSVDALYFLAMSSEASQSSVEEGAEVQLLRLVKCLKQGRKIGERVDTYILTADNFSLDGRISSCAGAGAAGLGHSLAQGNYQFRVRNLDLTSTDLQSAANREQLFALISREPPSDRGEIFKIAAGKRYRQAFSKLSWGPSRPSAIKQNGVYLLVGGSGIVGRIVTRGLIEKYQANVIWLGRSAEDSSSVKSALQSFTACGDKLVYVQANVLNAESMRQALATVKSRHAVIHGAIFAAMVFGVDNSIDQISEAQFDAVVGVKTLGSRMFHAALEHEALDFMCYFSSGQAYSFSGASKVAAYAAGIASADSFARSVKSRGVVPVGVINWGAWQAFVKERMGNQDASARNMGAFEDHEGFECFERFVSSLQDGSIHQVLCMRAAEEVAALMNCNREELVTLVGKTATSAGFDENAIAIPQQRIAHLIQVKASSQIDAWFSRLLLQQLNRLLLATGSNVPATALDMQQSCGILDKYAPWVSESLRLLGDNGCIELHDGAIRGWDAKAAQASWQDWQSQKLEYAKDPQTRALSVLVNDCLEKLPDILTGKVSATEVIFPNSSMEKVASLYQKNAVADTFNEIVANAVLNYLQQRQKADPQVRLRILEIGAGTGGTSAMVFSKLRSFQQAVQEYCYTDLSKAFFLHAEANYVPENPYVVCRRLDIEQPIEAQGIDLGAYDLVIATNVLHATRDIRQTLRNAKAALRKDGFILLNEMSDKSLSTHLTVALLDGWWLFEDAELRIPGCPGLYPQGWQRVLEAEGFSAVRFPAEQAHGLGNQIIVARSDGMVRQQLATTSQSRIETRTRALEKPTAVASQTRSLASGISSSEYVRSCILECLSGTLKIAPASIEPDIAFSDYGVDSILGVNFVQQLNERLRIALNTAVIFEYSSLDRLSKHILAAFAEQIEAQSKAPSASAPVESHATIKSARRPASRSAAEARKNSGNSHNDYPEIAVVGMAGRFPKAENVREFWSNLVDGVDGVEELPPQYLDPTYFSPNKQKGKTRCKWGGVLAERDCFDPLFFNLSPKEAEAMNPHQRLVMQESWNAIEDAGYNPKALAGTQTGIFVGAEPTGYFGDTFTGLSEAIIASRLSYVLNLNGPAFVVNTGCSSSGVAIHLACESLRNRETDLVLAGGVHACMSQVTQIRLDEIEMLSPSGRCFTFDKAGDGTIVSEGIGMVVLKRLDDAIAAGDHIYGTISGSGINQDGASNGITAPNGAAQELLIKSVYDKFQIDPEQISYIEAHGTGTKLGDPVETNALVRAFKAYTGKQGYCAVGSAKSHIGHTAAAAGVTGLIKILLSMQHRQLPKLLNFKTLNPAIEFQASPFFIPTETTPWQPAGHHRMAALNSFGHSGTNVHLVIKEHGPMVASQAFSPARKFIVPLSARSQDRLQQKCRDLLEFIAATEATMDLASLSFTLQTGREAMEERVGFVVDSVVGLAEKLRSFVDGHRGVEGVFLGQAPRGRGNVEISLALTDVELERRVLQWTQGATLDWTLLWSSQPQRMSLPGYPFAKERYWAAGAVVDDPAPRNLSTMVANRASIEDIIDRIDDESIDAGDGVKLLRMIV